MIDLEPLKQALLRASHFLDILIAMTNRDKLYQVAFKYASQHRDASPNDEAPDEYGCMNSVSSITQEAIPGIKFPMILSTSEGLKYLQKSPHFIEVLVPKKGTIILFATATGNGIVKNGHTGVCGEHTSPDGSLWVMTNDSRTGTFAINFTVNSMLHYYHDKGGMEPHYFDAL